MTQQSLRHKSAWLVATILVVALLAPEWPGARIALAVGSVEIGRGEPPVWKPGEPGDALGAGDRVRTGADGRAEVAVEGATLRLYPNSLLRLPETAPKGAARAVELNEGTSLFDVLRRNESPFEVRTPEVVVSVKGTRFGVSVGDHDASVSVFRGLVGVRSGSVAAAPETLVHPGFLAWGSERFELGWHGADDPWESWSRGELDPGSLGGERREAALQDARVAALELARELPRPASRDAAAEGKPRVDTAELKGDDPAVVAPRDPIADATEEMRQTLDEEFIEDLVNGPTDPVGQLLEVAFDESDSDQVFVRDLVNGVTWSFEQDELENILEGEDSLPPGLLDILSAQSVSPTQFTSQLLSGLDD